MLRFAYFYGPDAAQVIDAIRFARHGWALLPGAPQSYCSSVSHDDAAGAVVAALGARAGAYNVSDDEPLTRREYFDLLAKALGVAPPKIAPPWVATLFGSLGKMLSDDTLYKRLDTLTARMDSLATRMEKGEGSLAKLMNDPDFYDNLNGAAKDARTLIADVKKNPSKYLRVQLKVF